MKWLQSIGREEGFTIQEILVVLIVSSLLVSFGLSLFQSTNKLVGMWERKNEVHSLVNGITQRIALDVQKSNSVNLTTDSSLVLKDGIGNKVVFRFNNSSVWRSDVQMGEVLQGQLRFHVAIDPAGRTYTRIGFEAFDENAVVHVSSPWSSRKQFSQLLKGWNAASNRH